MIKRVDERLPFCYTKLDIYIWTPRMAVEIENIPVQSGIQYLFTLEEDYALTLNNNQSIYGLHIVTVFQVYLNVMGHKLSVTQRFEDVRPRVTLSLLWSQMDALESYVENPTRSDRSTAEVCDRIGKTYLWTYKA